MDKGAYHNAALALYITTYFDVDYKSKDAKILKEHPNFVKFMEVKEPQDTRYIDKRLYEKDV